MALIVKSIGWEAPEDGDEEFIIRLHAQTKNDIPNLSADIVWKRIPVKLSEDQT